MTLPGRTATLHPGREPEDPPVAFALAPLGVLPSLQRTGIGTALTETGLSRCRAARAVAVVVLGDPAYYPRFGFRPAETWGLRSRWDVPNSPLR